ncbi:MAG TPA: winged helix-turn-helix domain-containing protein [Sphingobium sp.]|uniref:winged helix-turn-helix domain-containing protein n=1 Tax=Sphingobium sp. TaxID=1912891 RepID=UPI002ED5F25D
MTFKGIRDDTRRHEQADVEHPILEVLEKRSPMSTIEITKAVRSRLHLFPADLARANKRENESKIDQIIANALQAKRRLCSAGLIERIDKGEFRITDCGHTYLSNFRDQVDQMMQTLEEMFPDTHWD